MKRTTTISEECLVPVCRAHITVRVSVFSTGIRLCIHCEHTCYTFCVNVESLAHICVSCELEDTRFVWSESFSLFLSFP